MGLLNVIRAIVYEAPPILTVDLTLGNLKRENKEDFVFSDFSQIMGKLSISLLF